MAVVVVMGVSGSGKTTVGTALAERLGVPYAEADEFHPKANIDKMTSGVPLTDADREPWLRAIAAWVGERAADGGVVTCSALKRPYRDLLRAGGPAWFLHLHGSPEVIASRMAGRTGHFMPPSLLASQLADLEPLGADEPGMTVDVTRPVAEIVAEAASAAR
ncbi:gluconokinase [Actinokineospora soli]|uniref:Gluconokinase n=1 Tax=Actinokineospora soli TaxID=1048753 RepID=A0ABW2TRR8_9PSEU